MEKPRLYNVKIVQNRYLGEKIEETMKNTRATWK